MSQRIPRHIKLPTSKVFISLLYHFTRLISLAPKNKKERAKKTIKIRNPVMLYLIDMIQVQISLSLINTETKKVISSVATKARTKFLSGNDSKNVSKFLFFQKYRTKNPSKPTTIISFHIQIKVQRGQAIPSLYVIKVWKKNCNKSQIKKIFAMRVRILITLS